VNGDEEIFARCAERRLALADLLESLTDEQLSAQSLCGEWDVRTLFGHLTVPLVVSPARVAWAVVRNGGSFPRASSALSREAASQPVSTIAATLRDRARSRFTPPMHGAAAPLTDLCVHANDIRVPLGMPCDVTPDEAETTLDMLTGFSMFFIPRGRLRGIRLVPNDLDRTWGDGAEVAGPAGDLLMAVLGRTGFLEALDGPGAALLADRLG
jgi:uncharacterized protein (TIGR03083 family)